MSERKQKKIAIKKCYVASSGVIDKYTVYTNIDEGNGSLGCFCMSDYPDHPQGVSQYSSGVLGKHNGRSVTFDSLPANIKIHVYLRMNDGVEGPPQAIKIPGGFWKPTSEVIEGDKRFHREHNVFYVMGDV